MHIHVSNFFIINKPKNASHVVQLNNKANNCVACVVIIKSTTAYYAIQIHMQSSLISNQSWLMIKPRCIWIICWWLLLILKTATKIYIFRQKCYPLGIGNQGKTDARFVATPTVSRTKKTALVCGSHRLAKVSNISSRGTNQAKFVFWERKI
jgi:hypothetical protein